MGRVLSLPFKVYLTPTGFLGENRGGQLLLDGMMSYQRLFAEQSFKKIQIDRVGAKFAPPAGTSVGIQRDANGGDTSTRAHPHSVHQLRYASNPDDPNVFTFFPKSGEKGFQIGCHPNVRLDAVTS